MFVDGVMNTRAWRYLIGTLLLLLFLTKGKLAAPPPASVGHRIQTNVGIAGP